jgi:hypothetical protein
MPRAVMAFAPGIPLACPFTLLAHYAELWQRIERALA